MKHRRGLGIRGMPIELGGGSAHVVREIFNPPLSYPHKWSATNCKESFGEVRFHVAPQKPTYGRRRLLHKVAGACHLVAGSKRPPGQDLELGRRYRIRWYFSGGTFLTNIAKM